MNREMTVVSWISAIVKRPSDKSDDNAKLAVNFSIISNLSRPILIVSASSAVQSESFNTWQASEISRERVK